MNDLRWQFEALPGVAKYLGYVFWNEKTQGYCNNGDNLVSLDFASFFNGAWYAYQEQQKKIDSLLDKVCGTHEDFLNEFGRCNTLPKQT